MCVACDAHQSIKKKKTWCIANASWCPSIKAWPFCLSHCNTRRCRANQRPDEPWLVNGQKSDWPCVLSLAPYMEGAGQARHVLSRMRFQCARSWYVTHLSSLLFHYTMCGDTTVVCKAFARKHEASVQSLCTETWRWCANPLHRDMMLECIAFAQRHGASVQNLCTYTWC